MQSSSSTMSLKETGDATKNTKAVSDVVHSWSMASSPIEPWRAAVVTGESPVRDTNAEELTT